MLFTAHIFKNTMGIMWEEGINNKKYTGKQIKIETKCRNSWLLCDVKTNE